MILNELIKLLAILCLFILLDSLQAGQNQNLSIPLDIQKAYQRETRSPDGKPGKNYWQNRSDYQIKVTLDPKSRILNGQSKIIYHNESPDSLDRIVIRLYQDILKRGNSRDWPVDTSDLHDGMQIHRLLLNNQAIDLDNDSEKYSRSATNLILKLTDPLDTAEKAYLEIDWSFVVGNSSNIRMGTYDSSSFFIAYWYPQIAVYDDINGWDTYDYGGLQEFYNDFANFDIEVTVPGNYIVWATGNLQNPDAVLSEKYLGQYRTAQNSAEIIQIISVSDLERGGITKNEPNLTWKFRAETVPDFAFACSNHYLWDMTSLIVDKQTKRKVIIDAAYKAESKDFYEVADIAQKAIAFFSEKMPAIPFPYAKLTVFNGAGGMEFPMMVNDGSEASRAGTVGLTSHEIAHSYFPFYMGINERKYAWMDEGWAVMLPFDFQSTMVENNDRKAAMVAQYAFGAGKELDLPMITPSIVFSGNVYRTSYRFLSYDKASIAYEMLRDLVGEEKFKMALHEFVERWNGKHPIPYDFFFTFNAVLGEDLHWFWKPWFFEQGFPDLGIKGVNMEHNFLEIEVVRHGILPLPVKLRLIFEDDSEKVIEESARIWQKGAELISLKVDIEKVFKRIELGTVYIPDVNQKNNIYEIKKE